MTVCYHYVYNGIMSGSEIREIREGMGLSREKFAQMVGYSYSLIHKIETGERETPKVLTKLLTLILKRGSQNEGTSG